MEKRRRTDQLTPLAEAGSDVRLRAADACQALVADGGMRAACLMQVGGTLGAAHLCDGAGEFPRIVEVARGLAERAAESGSALHLVDGEDPDVSLTWHFAAILCGAVDGSQLVLIVGDPSLSVREAQRLAAWAASPEPVDVSDVAGGPCAPLARDIARRFAGDVVIISLFTQSGMLLNMHVRSGALLRSWRLPFDSVWAEAAKHNAAYVLGELQMHPGAEFLAEMGYETAAVVGLENGQGVALGSFGVASPSNLSVDVAAGMLERAATLGPEIMQLRGKTEVPRVTDEGINLHVFAARVGCQRFALYARTSNGLQLVSAHAEDGSKLISPPDPLEEQLVMWAIDRGAAASSTDAAAVRVGDDTVLYASDRGKEAMECLRLALQDLRFDPYGKAA